MLTDFGQFLCLSVLAKFSEPKEPKPQDRKSNNKTCVCVGPKGGAPKGGAPKGGGKGAKISRFCFLLPPRGILVVFFKRAGVAPKAAGASHDSQRTPKRAFFRVPAHQNTTTIQREDPQQKKRERKVGGKIKHRLGPTLPGPTLPGLTHHLSTFVFFFFLKKKRNCNCN